MKTLPEFTGIIPIYMGSTLTTPSKSTYFENHPHIHGEYLKHLPARTLMAESSPYTWGVGSLVPRVLYLMGIIPIYMGSTISTANNRFVVRNHPHIHGEYHQNRSLSKVFLESSPYTWGVHFATIRNDSQNRIIPIYMGSTTLLTLEIKVPKNHPHIHGEYALLVLLITSLKESSPYTWGVP